MNYFELQQAVFNHLWEKHHREPNFTFSVRQKANRGAEKNYFIGTEASKYFGFTCWDIYVSYPGSASDLTEFYYYLGDDKVYFFFEYNTSKEAEGEQNEIDLEFGYALLEKLRNAGFEVIEKRNDDRVLKFRVETNTDGYAIINELLAAFDELYVTIAPIVDSAMDETKAKYPNWIAGRYTQEKFERLVENMHARINKNRESRVQNVFDSFSGSGSINITSMKNNVPRPLNSILFGPPGTGKTYKLQTLISEMRLVEAAQSASTDFSAFVSGFTWWQLLAMALVEKKKLSVPELLDHSLIKAKLATSNIQHPPQRLWSTLQHHTVKSCPNVKGERRFGELIFYKEADSTWRLDNETDFKQQSPYLVTEWENFTKGNGPTKEQKNYTFVTCHQSLTYEDFIEGIKPSLEQKDEGDAEEKLQYQIRKGLFYQTCEKAAQKAGFTTLREALEVNKEIRKEKFNKAKEENNIHVLFLDEINRCNVSAVFGELITLIEDDKRLGANNEIADISLPYSQSLFGVPSNLYIIGTMNTADRSVEALDTALRRRFVFEEMQPKTELLSPYHQIWRLWLKHWTATKENSEWKTDEQNLVKLTGMQIDDDKYNQLSEDYEHDPLATEWKIADPIVLFKDVVSFSNGVELDLLLKTINIRLEALLTKDHTIGHAWLMDVYSLSDLQNVFKNKILPLLQEYFYNNYAKIGLVLGDRFFEEQKKVEKKIFANFNNGTDITEDYNDKIIYKLKDATTLTHEDFKSIYQ